jgi:hypothetical protein
MPVRLRLVINRGNKPNASQNAEPSAKDISGLAARPDEGPEISAIHHP